MTDDEIDALYAQLHDAEATGADASGLQRRIDAAEKERAEEMTRHFWSHSGLTPAAVDSLLARVDAALGEDPVAEAARKMRDGIIGPYVESEMARIRSEFWTNPHAGTCRGCGGITRTNTERCGELSLGWERPID